MSLASVGLPLPPQSVADRPLWEYKVVHLRQGLIGWQNQAGLLVIEDAQKNEQLSTRAGEKAPCITEILNWHGTHGWEVVTIAMTRKGNAAFQDVMKRQVR